MKKQKTNKRLSLNKLSIASIGDEGSKIYGGSNPTVPGCTDSWCCPTEIKPPSYCVCPVPTQTEASCCNCPTYNC